MDTRLPVPPGNGGGPGRKRKRIWAFAGGKGGVGRSFLAANLAVQLARSGRSVTLIDLDLDNPTLHAFLGPPGRVPGLSALSDHGGTRLPDCLEKIPCGELYFGRGIEGPTGPVEELLDRVAARIRNLGTEFVLLDLGSSRCQPLTGWFRMADIGLVVVTPDPLTLQGSYAFLSQIKKESANPTHCPGDPPTLPPGEGQAPAGIRGVPAPRGEERFPKGDSLPFLVLLVNRVRVEEDSFPGRALQSGLWKIHAVPTRFLGSIPEDPAVFQALERGRPVSLQYPNSPSSIAIGAFLKEMDSLGDPPGWKPRETEAKLEAQDYYEILEVPKGTTHRRIQAAYESLRRIYRPGSLLLPGTVKPADLQRITEGIEQAYRTLIFLETRRQYDRRLFASDVGGDLPPAGSGGRLPLPNLPEKESDSGETAGEDFAAPEAEFSGEALRQIRQRRQVSLESITEITKIRKLHLECIEEENFSYLPAPVFLKGFLRAYAQCLALDPEGVCQDYMNRYERWALSRKEPPPSHREEGL